MPEMWFEIAWPNGQVETCYSPSLVVKEMLTEGQDYALADFMQRSRTALNEASARVRQKFGFPCSRAMATLAALEQSAKLYETSPDAKISVRRFIDKG